MVVESTKIFLSYATSDRVVADQVEEYLRQNGFDVFRDLTSIQAGTNWDIAIEQALRDADCMVLLLSPSSMPYRREVHREWFFYDQARKPIYPVLIAKCDLHSRLYAYNYIDARRDLQEALKKLVQQLRRPFIPVPMSHPRERIVISNNAEGHDSAALIRDLAAVIRGGEHSIALTSTEVEQLLRHSPSSADEYRLERIAEWSQSRYQLDHRFVHLTLLTDQGELARGGRWQETLRFSDLLMLLEDVPDPALVLLGPPGSGKSTLLRRLQLDDAIDGIREGKARLTFLTQLSQYRASGLADPPPPLEWLARRWRSRYANLPPLEDLLAEGRLLLLLDALNEMPHRSVSDYRERIDAWRHFLQESIWENSGNRVIFACRSLEYSTPLSSQDLRVPQVRVEPMTPEQVRQFLKVYSPGYEDTIWEELKGSTLLNLYRTPYFLKLLIDQVEAEKGIPKGRAGLFTGFVRQSLQREIDSRNPLFIPDRLLTQKDCDKVNLRAWRSVVELPDRGQLIPKLSDLAFQMQLSQISSEGVQVRIGYDTACGLLSSDLAEDVLHAGTALNVLEQDAVQEEVYFFHQLLQEYFAARRLATELRFDLMRVEWRADKVKPSLADVLSVSADSDLLPSPPATGWEETTRLAAAICRKPEAFMRGLLEVNPALAGQCSASPEVRVDTEVREEVRQHLVLLVEDETVDLRARMLLGLVLGELGHPLFELQETSGSRYLMPPLRPIPAGTYPIGSTDYAIESPQHVVVLESFLLGQFPVTNAEFGLFVTAGGYEDEQWWDTAAAKAWRLGNSTAEGPKRQWREGRQTLQGMFARERERDWLQEVRLDRSKWLEMSKPPMPSSTSNVLIHLDSPVHRFVTEGRITRKQAAQWEAIAQMSDTEFELLLSRWYPGGALTKPEYWEDTLFNNPLQPVVGVSWYEARAYCCWLSKQTGMPFRLPTEAEWEAAARGLLGRRYAYGDRFVSGCGNTFESHIRRTSPVGLFRSGSTPEGCADMSGNVWEWTSSIYECYPYRADDGREEQGREDVQRVLRGGSWNDIGSYSRGACRFHYPPSNRYPFYGFRLCMSVCSSDVEMQTN